MQNLAIPFNITLLIPDKRMLSMLRPVTSLTAFDANRNFHPDGLYSTETFGVVGTPARESKYSYINIRISILHPVIFKTLISMKSLYKDIMSSREFAVWDDEKKDFIKSNAIDGQTGYQFFIEHFQDIIFEEKSSVRREQSIRLLDKYKNDCLVDNVIVMPAGYRDIELDNNGRESSDEINDIYYSLLSISNTINPSTVNVSPEAYNSQRMSLQNKFVELYDYINTIVDGKKNLMMGKWASRKIFNGTRNVITSQDTTILDLDDPDNITINDTLIGLFQTMKAILPIAIYNLRTKFLSEVFTSSNSLSLLTNKKTLMSERVLVQAKEFDKWMTNEGIEKIIDQYQETSIRHEPIKVEQDYYLGLIYKGPDGTFKLIHGIDELPPDRSQDDCSPITYTELFYLSIYNIANNYPIFVTRYPITGIGSVYPSKVRLKTTVESEVRKELGYDWLPIGETNIAKEFPLKTSTFFNSLSPSSSRLAGLGADFDGDTASANIPYTDEAIEENRIFLNSKACYVNSDGRLTYDNNTDTIKFVLKVLTG